MNIHDYTGAPYDFRSNNCWHHVHRVRKDAGIFTPEFAVVYNIEAAFEAGRQSPKGLTRQQMPENYDVVLLGFEHAGRIIWHSGIYFDGCVSHCERAAKQVKFEELADLKETYTEIEFWR